MHSPAITSKLPIHATCCVGLVYIYIGKKHRSIASFHLVRSRSWTPFLESYYKTGHHNFDGQFRPSSQLAVHCPPRLMTPFFCFFWHNLALLQITVQNVLSIQMLFCRVRFCHSGIAEQCCQQVGHVGWHL